MVKCQICGLEKEISIVEHLRHTHKMTVPEYRDQYKDAEVKSEKAKKIISEQHKRVWQDEDYKRKMCESRQITHRSSDFRLAQSERLKKIYELGYKNWNDGLTKEVDSRIESIGRKNSKNLAGRTKEEHDYLLQRSLKLSGKPIKGFDRSDWSEERIQSWRNKISESVSQGIAECKYKSYKNSFSKGWFLRKNLEKEYYDSSWELELMKHLDEIDGILWTKRHGIIISYVDENETVRRYIPDFFIEKNHKKVLLELKGYSRSEHELEAKKKSAEIWAFENSASYKLCWSIDEARDAIKEIL